MGLFSRINVHFGLGIITLSSSIFGSPIKAETLSGQVISVGDGDTIRVSVNGKPITARLACIDAPEMAQQPYGLASRNRLQQLLPINSSVILQVADTDRYGRSVAKIYKGNLSINLTLVQEGQAVVYNQYLGACPELRDRLIQSESRAKSRQIGFWNQPNPVMPWDFRRNPKPVIKPKQTSPAPSTKPAPSAGSPIRDPISGRCQCPYDYGSSGKLCGSKSAYSRPGGESPQCYVGE
jgi:micrococcal nuclease